MPRRIDRLGWSGSFVTEIAVLADQKRALRRTMATRRDGLQATGGVHAAENLAKHLAPKLHGQRFSVVASYVPMRSELNPQPLLASLLTIGGCAALPVVMGAGQPLLFRIWNRDMPLDAGPLGTSHPGVAQDEVVPDLFLVPLLAFDRRRHRLGYGAGYYDRTLTALRAKKQIIAIGVAFAGQEVDAVPVDQWDQPLDMIVTELGLI